MEVVNLLHQLEELDKAAQRSVAAEVESAMESGACLVDDVGRERILAICAKVRRSCEKLSASNIEQRLERELQAAAMGMQPWQKEEPGSSEVRPETEPSSSSSTIPLLRVPRSRCPLSLWDWKVWSQARPTLWRYGDACNLYPERETPMTVNEWMACLMLREELEYS